MPRILGRASSINVRKVLWTCDELGVPVAHEPWGQDGLRLDSPEFLRLNPNGAILDACLAHTGAFVTGTQFTLADIVLGLSTHRWYATPFPKPELPHVERFHRALDLRPGFRRHGNNGEP